MLNAELLPSGGRTISISIVSHGQSDLVRRLLSDIERCCETYSIEVLLTINLPEEIAFAERRYPFLLRIIRNSRPQGFGANHNQAFAQAAGEFFCVMNPDIRFERDPFPSLLWCLQDAEIGVAAPLVLGEDGGIEDSARRFPTPFKILCKAVGGCKGGDYSVREGVLLPDWIGGMFMLFVHATFAKMRGFDERYFLYYEDVDLCARLKLSGYRVLLCADARVVHLARRDSHRNLKFLKWHMTSMMRFFCSRPFWAISLLRLRRTLLMIGQTEK